MKRLWLAFILALLVSSPALPQGPVVGQFDYYVLALAWQPGFCEIRPSIPECQSQDKQRFDAKNLVLHGLWPSVREDDYHTYSFCNVRQSIQETDQEQQWCELPSLNLAADTVAKLSAMMPGTQSCLERHEWFKHGTCSGLSENKYFVKSLEFVETIVKTRLNAHIAANVGKYVSLQALQSVFEKDFGEGSREFVRFQCARMYKASFLTEVRLYLRKDRLDQPLSKESFTEPAVSEEGTCEDEFLIDLPG